MKFLGLKSIKKDKIQWFGLFLALKKHAENNLLQCISWISSAWAIWDFKIGALILITASG